MSKSSSSTSTGKAVRSSANMPSKGSSRTSNGATKRPNRRRCAKSWRSTALRATVPECLGTRLNRAARNVFVDGKSAPEVSSLSVDRAIEFFSQLKLPGWRGEIAVKIVKEIGDRLGFLANVGLGYLTLNRSADTLSGGEAQRIRLASQIGSGLVGVMYILDEPSIGLHQRDNQRLLDALINLRDLGNTVIVVEHDEEAIRQADYVVDLGPGAGVHGGRIVAQGTRGAGRRSSGFDHGPVSERSPPHRDSEVSARRRSQAHAASHRRHRQQPEESHGGVSARSDDLHHRSVGIRQIDAWSTIPCFAGWRRSSIARRPAPRISSGSKVWSTSIG